MNKRTTAIVVWAFVAFLIFEIGLSNLQRGGSGTDSGGSTALPKPTSSVEYPATFLMPDFTAKTENEVRAWVAENHIVASLELNYGDAQGTACQREGKGIVSFELPKAGTMMRNVPSTNLYMALYCRY